MLIALSFEQYAHQRVERNGFTIAEEVILPWYLELARAYTATPYGAWKGDRQLLVKYNALVKEAGFKWHELRYYSS